MSGWDRHRVDMSVPVDTVRTTPIERTSVMPHDDQRPPGEVPDQGNEAGTVTIDCDDCAVRGAGCRDCVVSVLLGVPENLLLDERRALEVLAEVGLAPRLRLVPIHRQGHPGVA